MNFYSFKPLKILEHLTSSFRRNNDLKVGLVCALYFIFCISNNFEQYFRSLKKNIVIAPSLNTIG